MIKREDSELFTTLQKKGITYWTALEERRQDKCPVDVPKDQAKFDKYWTERIAQNAPPALLPQFNSRLIKNGEPLPNHAFIGVEYRSQDANKKPDKTAFDNLYAP